MTAGQSILRRSGANNSDMNSMSSSSSSDDSPSDDSRRSSSSSSSSVHFLPTLTTVIHTRPRTPAHDKPNLYYSARELQKFKQQYGIRRYGDGAHERRKRSSATVIQYSLHEYTIDDDYSFVEECASDTNDHGDDDSVDEVLKAHNDITYHDEEQQQEQELGNEEEEEQSHQSSSENNKKPIYESEDIVSIAKENCIDMMKRQQQNGGARLRELLEGNTSDIRASSSSPRPRPRHDNSFWRTKVQWRWQSSSSSASRSESRRAERLTGSGSNYCDDDSQPLYSVVEHQKEDRRNVMVPFSGRACLLDII